MFDKVKDLNNLRKAQSEMKKKLEQIFVTVEESDIKVKIRGDKKIIELEVGGKENSELKNVLNDAFKDVDKKVEKQMRGQLGNLGIPGL